MKTPFFWYEKGAVSSLVSTLLLPLTLLWRLASMLSQIFSRREPLKIPVIIVGNLTAGGGGKTPLAADLAKAFTTAGYQPYLLSRGYGGRISAAHRVRSTDTSDDVGDEAKWLAQYSPIVVARNRLDGGRFIEKTAASCRVIIMDDGLQNRHFLGGGDGIFRIGVFSGSAGIGNGRLLPSGPLRVSLKSGLGSLDAAVISGDDSHNLAPYLRRCGYTEAIYPHPRQLNQSHLARLKDTSVLAFAGIAHPHAFFAMLRESGINIAASRSFPDHHPYTDAELADLAVAATKLNAQLVTTEKDFMRLPANYGASIAAIGLTTTLDNRLFEAAKAAVDAYSPLEGK